ncbi:MAG TPA: chemotaxis protein CheW [Micavibrio sp.]|nr:chemotaxis protein CheW [Micavibrio sp.]
MSALAAMEKTETSNVRELLTVTIGGQLFGIPILQVQDVLGTQKITRIPLAPKEVAGALNLRGRIVTAIDMRACLGMEPRGPAGKSMGVVIEYQGELFSLMIDRAGDVMHLPYSAYEKNPSTLDPQWRAMCQGIYRLKDKLLVVLDIPRLLEGLQTP